VENTFDHRLSFFGKSSNFEGKRMDLMAKLKDFQNITHIAKLGKVPAGACGAQRGNTIDFPFSESHQTLRTRQ